MTARRVALFLSLSITALPIGTLAAAQKPAPYLDSTLPVAQRVDDLIGRMTLEEKVSQTIDVAPAIPRLNIPA